MRITFAHVCDYASVSREGKLSVNGIFDRVNAPSVPVVHPMMYLAFEFEATAAELGRDFTLEIKLATEDGKDIMKTEVTAAIQAPPPGAQAPLSAKIPQVMALAGVPLPRFGRYGFYLWINGDLKREASFEVTLTDSTPQPLQQ